MTGATASLPLKTRTSTTWADAALAEPDRLLDDHAHLERKAATNALALLHRWPTGTAAGEVPPDDLERAQHWARVLTAIARDEIEHLGIVLRLLRGRGRALGRLHRNPYASELRRLVRDGRGADELVDRLLVSALIEARSCERFERLGEVATDPDLQRLYRGLQASERGHFRVFLDLARALPGARGVDERFEDLLQEEARVLARQAPGPRMHAGEPRAWKRSPRAMMRPARQQEESPVAVDPEVLSDLFSSQLRSMKHEDLAHVASLLEPRSVPAGERLIARGEPSDRLYFVVEGLLDITLDCKKTVLKLGQRGNGEWVGELGLIEPGPASAHVDATVDTRLWELTHDQYMSLVADRPMEAASFTEMICRDVARRLRECDAVTFRRDADGGVLAVHPEEPEEGLLGHLKRLFGQVRS